MKIEDLSGQLELLQFPNAEEQVHPDRDTVRAARDLVSEAVGNDDFLTQCLSHELEITKAHSMRCGLVPFYTLPRTGIGFAFGHWSPGTLPGPHEHTAWTITAICRNELVVHTFDRTKSFQLRKLVPDKQFRVTAGMVGYVHTPCIHEPRNVSAKWTLSLHLISPRDGEPLPDQISIPGLNNRQNNKQKSYRKHPYQLVIQERQRARILSSIAFALTSVDTSKSLRIIDQYFSIFPKSIQRTFQIQCPHCAQFSVDKLPFYLRRTDADLELDYHAENGIVSLNAYTPHGQHKEIEINELAIEAVAFVTKNNNFNVQQLPGKLTTQERESIGELLEYSGLFIRDNHHG